MFRNMIARRGERNQTEFPKSRKNVVFFFLFFFHCWYQEASGNKLFAKEDGQITNGKLRRYK